MGGVIRPCWPYVASLTIMDSYAKFCENVSRQIPGWLFRAHSEVICQLTHGKLPSGMCRRQLVREFVMTHSRPNFPKIAKIGIKMIKNSQNWDKNDQKYP